MLCSGEADDYPLPDAESRGGADRRCGGRREGSRIFAAGVWASFDANGIEIRRRQSEIGCSFVNSGPDDAIQAIAMLFNEQDSGLDRAEQVEIAHQPLDDFFAERQSADDCAHPIRDTPAAQQSAGNGVLIERPNGTLDLSWLIDEIHIVQASLGLGGIDRGQRHPPERRQHPTNPGAHRIDASGALRQLAGSRSEAQPGIRDSLARLVPVVDETKGKENARLSINSRWATPSK